jgi:hypothetical protein
VVTVWHAVTGKEEHPVIIFIALHNIMNAVSTLTAIELWNLRYFHGGQDGLLWLVGFDSVIRLVICLLCGVFDRLWTVLEPRQFKLKNKWNPSWRVTKCIAIHCNRLSIEKPRIQLKSLLWCYSHDCCLIFSYKRKLSTACLNSISFILILKSTVSNLIYGLSKRLDSMHIIMIQYLICGITCCVKETEIILIMFIQCNCYSVNPYFLQ